LVVLAAPFTTKPVAAAWCVRVGVTHGKAHIRLAVAGRRVSANEEVPAGIVVHGGTDVVLVLRIRASAHAVKRRKSNIATASKHLRREAGDRAATWSTCASGVENAASARPGGDAVVAAGLSAVGNIAFQSLLTRWRNARNAARAGSEEDAKVEVGGTSAALRLVKSLAKGFTLG